MLYTVVVDGVPVQCETPAAVIALVREAAAAGVAVGVPNGQAAATRPADGAASPGSRWTEQRIREFFRAIKPQQRKLVEALLETPDGRTDDQLCQHLGLADGRALAGVFTGLFKNAKKVGADPKDLYQRHSVTIGDKRQFEYTLADGFRSAAKKWRA